MWAWQSIKAQYTAAANGWSRLCRCRITTTCSSVRKSERCCRCAQISVSASSRGAHSLAASSPVRGITTARTATDENGMAMYGPTDRTIVETVAAVATARGVSPAQIGLVWHHTNPVVTAPIVGATKPQHLTDAVAAVDLELSADEIAILDSPNIPNSIAGQR